jgi:hypothetical protein
VLGRRRQAHYRSKEETLWEVTASSLAPNGCMRFSLVRFLNWRVSRFFCISFSRLFARFLAPNSFSCFQNNSREIWFAKTAENPEAVRKKLPSSFALPQKTLVRRRSQSPKQHLAFRSRTGSTVFAKTADALETGSRSVRTHDLQAPP